MDLFDDTRSVERPRFFDGQQLFASDLDGIVAFHRAMRWLHNRSLHQPGIGNGFAVAGRRGEREVRVQPGYALDARGREIVLLDTHAEPVPPVASESDGGPVFFDLTASYPPDDDLEEAETREGVCLPRGVVRLRERPVFCWVRLRRDVTGNLRPLNETDALDIQAGLKIVVARAQVRECRLDADLSIAIRRNARPPREPTIACGSEKAAWKPWVLPNPDGAVDLAIGLWAPVDTRAAGFRLTPCYSARVSGPRPVSVMVSGGELSGSTSVSVLDRAVYVTDAGPGGFTCYVAVDAVFPARTVDQMVLDALDDLAQEKWQVTWLGIEA